jgi:hypothetical protein
VKIRGARGVHVVQQLLQTGLLLRAALQKQLYPIQLHIGRNGAAVVAGVGQRVVRIDENLYFEYQKELGPIASLIA